MDIPKKIKIGNLNYDIKLLDLEDKKLGESNHKYQWIKLHPDLKQESKEETLIHEVIHQILDDSGYFEESDNEKLVNILANGIYQVFRDNEFLK